MAPQLRLIDEWGPEERWELVPSPVYAEGQSGTTPPVISDRDLAAQSLVALGVVRQRHSSAAESFINTMEQQDSTAPVMGDFASSLERVLSVDSTYRQQKEQVKELQNQSKLASEELQKARSRPHNTFTGHLEQKSSDIEAKLAAAQASIRETQSKRARYLKGAGDKVNPKSSESKLLELECRLQEEREKRVDDHAAFESKFKSMEASISKIFNKMANVQRPDNTPKFKELANTCSNQSKTIQKLSQQIKDLTSLKPKVEEIVTQMATVSAGLSKNNEAIEAVDSRYTRLQEPELGRLTHNAVHPWFTFVKNLKVNIDAINQTHKSIDQRLLQNEAAIKFGSHNLALWQRAQMTTTDNLQKTNQGCQNLVRSFEGIEGRLQQVEAKLTDASLAMAANKEDFLTDSSNMITEFKAAKQWVEGKFGDITSQMEKMETMVKALEAGQPRLSESTALRSEAKTIRSLSIDLPPKAISSLKEQEISNQSSAHSSDGESSREVQKSTTESGSIKKRKHDDQSSHASNDSAAPQSKPRKRRRRPHPKPDQGSDIVTVSD